MPKSEIPSIAISIAPKHVSVNQLAYRLRTGSTAVVGTVVDNSLKLDLRTVFEQQDHTLGDAIAQALAN